MKGLNGRLVVVNQYDHTVLVVDASTHEILGEVSVGVNGHEVDLSEDGQFAYVPIYSNVGAGQPGTDGRQIDVIDLAEIKLDRTIDLGKAVRPHRALFGANRLLYVTAELDNALYAVDVTTDTVVGRIPTGQEQTHMFVFSPDGTRAYTANISDGSVSVLDLVKQDLITIIPVAGMVQRISISVDGKWVFTHDQLEPRIAMIDTGTNEIVRWIDIPGVAFASTPTPDGDWLIVLSPKSHQLFVIDLKTLDIARTFDLPSSSIGLYLRPDGACAYVSCIGSGKIAVLDVTTWEMLPTIDLVPGVDGICWIAP